MSLEIKVIEMEAQSVLSIKDRTNIKDLPKLIGDSYGKIMAYLTEIGVYPSDAPFVGYFNMDINDLNVEIGFPVNKKIESKGEISASEIPAGKYVTCRHIGPYENFEETYNEVMSWMKENNYTMVGPTYEVYLNDPGEVKPEELITDIYILV